MKMSKMYLKTLRDDPAEAVIPSHKLLVRGGFIRKFASGIYAFMQPGYRTLGKIEKIIREEMDECGAQEIHMSAIMPAELWQETGRWSQYGPELWRIQDRHGRDFCLGPTHEEEFTDIARNDITSYRQLPAHLYQIQTKYRDEARPRFGLLRSREFVMKDSYSYDRDPEGLDKSYKIAYDAYTRIFTRLGLKFAPVEADSGAIGGNSSHEFTAFSEVGESDIVYCDKCGFAATTERAEGVDAPAQDDVEMLPIEKKHTPGTKTIEEVSDFLGIKPEETIKALLFARLNEETLETEGYIAAFVRGDRTVNDVKLVNALDIPEHCIEFADEADMGPITGSVAGFTGPVDLHDCTMIVDSELVGLKNMCAGACELDHHYINVNYGRDYKGDIVADIKEVHGGDCCPECGEELKQTRGIEVGQVFKLQTKYSEAMHAYYADENQDTHPIYMGCYGIGVSRSLAAIVEQYHDEQGIIWPVAVAPYHAIITLVDPSNEVQSELAEKIHDELKAKGIEVLLDDRDERAGVKFKDADLVGYPVRITVGKGSVDNKVEYKLRREDKVDVISSEESIERTVELVRAEGDGRCFFKK